MIRTSHFVSLLAALVGVSHPASAEPLTAASNLVAEAGFTVEFKIDLDGARQFEKLYEIPGVFALNVRRSNDGTAPAGSDTWLANYENFPLADGSCMVLEAVTADGCRIGVPLGALKNPTGVHAVGFSRTRVRWRLTVDERLDEDFPRDPLVWPLEAQGSRTSARVRKAVFVTPAKSVAAKRDAAPLTRPIQFWTPDDHNAWVGDVALCRWKGRLHLFYLFDRRHHASKQRGGGHEFAHLSSADLVHWTEHPNATSLGELWESHGTGLPFELDGKLCLAYGLHTERFVPFEKTSILFLEKWAYDHRKEGLFRFDELKGVPAGGTYAVSSDGIRFTPTQMMITRDENPSVYRRPDGRWGLGRAHGLWVTDSPRPEGWYRYDEETTTLGDCPCPFEWNGWHYLLQGFCFFAMSRTGESGSYRDRVMSDEHPYDGLSVPMVTAWKDGRRIIAGWIRFPGCWGGYLCLHELVQHADGTLGVKWLKEVTPETEARTFAVMPGKTLELRYKSAYGGPTLVFTVDAAKRVASYRDLSADGRYTEAATLAEMTRRSSRRHSNDIKGRPDFVESYAVANLRGLEKPADVRVIAHYDKKSNVTVFDAEIAGDRTMLCVRHGRFAEPETVKRGE